MSTTFTVFVSFGRAPRDGMEVAIQLAFFDDADNGSFKCYVSCDNQISMSAPYGMFHLGSSNANSDESKKQYTGNCNQYFEHKEFANSQTTFSPAPASLPIPRASPAEEGTLSPFPLFACNTKLLRPAKEGANPSAAGRTHARVNKCCFIVVCSVFDNLL